ncbi:MAG TPA: Xaa-Pro peptidase family protein [bacterium]|nr:Xaa-Pro peptidase family protein [bacterium]
MDFNGRMTAARRAMEQGGIDLLAIPPSDDLRYLTGFSPVADERSCYLFLSVDAGVFLVPALNADQAERHIRHPFVVYGDAEGPSRALDEAKRQLGTPRRIGAGDVMRADALLHLQRLWPDADYVVASDILGPLRMRKSAEEIALLKRAAATADRAFEAAVAASRSGASETELSQAAVGGFHAAGASEGTSSIVGSGPNSAFPHHHTSARRIEAGEPVLFDLGSKLDGYWSDLTRMAYLGKPAARYTEIHRIVDFAVRAALAVIKPGARIRDVDLAARDVIKTAGYEQYFTHRTGHGIGLSVHELPSITHTNDVPLEAGMTFSVEPGIYLSGEFGVRLEEIVAVTATGHEVLSRLSRDVRVIG